ncbi:hypothetical protein BGZ97_007027 [Linnemannia gamsii]|uniref:Uncharacterized protein n=1 Tax=Linnemannia gamsii TaxID=64522 RepID=A0A9P6QNS8_9FUNG|nr:hypothetical protein BGZ97_007027 [Linnemannia gamsii]
MDITNFLAYGLDERKWKLTTARTYKSALLQLFPAELQQEIREDEHFKEFLKVMGADSFKRLHNATIDLAPIMKGLQDLGDNHSMDFKDLTAKTCFLLSTCGLLRGDDLSCTDAAQCRIVDGTLELIVVFPKEKRGGERIIKSVMIKPHPVEALCPVKAYVEYRRRTSDQDRFARMPHPKLATESYTPLIRQLRRRNLRLGQEAISNYIATIMSLMPQDEGQLKYKARARSARLFFASIYLHKLPLTVIRDPHLFLDGFKTYCENSYGEAPFLASAQRLLCMAILDDQTRQQFTDELARHGSSSLTWEECEVAFVDSVLTPTERFNTVARVAEVGRRHKESYRNFALRLQRSVRVYRIDDNNATVLSGIMGSIPSMEVNLIKNSIQRSGTSLSEVKLNSISEILTNLSVMEGPDDSLKRPRNLNDDDSDDKSDVPLSKHDNKRQKRPVHRKNDRRSREKKTTGSSSPKAADKTFNCEHHGENISHDTKDCRYCTYCKKHGHTDLYCHKKDGKTSFDKKGGKVNKTRKVHNL